MIGDIKACIIIPSLEPNNRLLLLLEDLRNRLKEPDNYGIEAKIIVVNDGSAENFNAFYLKAKDEYNAVVLTHAVNLGKGRALKTAFNYFLCNHPDFHGVVTADSDGQHTAIDIIRCIKELSDGFALILGCRDFDCEDVPFKSRAGNKITRNVFRFFCGIKLTDTQTGLRGIPTGILKEMITVQGERFDYEMNMLVECADRSCKVREIAIETIYSGINRVSHFNPLKDSIKVYAIFVKYLLSSLSSSVVDISLFAVLQALIKTRTTGYIVIATVISRIASSLFNYVVNRKYVFIHGKSVKHSILRYYILAIIVMALSAGLTTLFYPILPFNEVLTKIIVDFLLFFSSYYLQKKWVFRKKTL